MDTKEMDKALWSLANAIAAFAAAQALVFIYAAIQHDLTSKMTSQIKAMIWIVAGVFATLYSLAILGCYWARSKNVATTRAWLMITVGRMAAAAVFSLLPVLTTCTKVEPRNKQAAVADIAGGRLPTPN